MLTKSIILFLLFFTFINATEYTSAVKEKKIYPLGKKIYTKKCTKIDSYTTKESLALQIKKSCKKLKPKHFEALSIYLWDNKINSKSKIIKMQKVGKKEKCQICGMWIYKYPKWVAQIQKKNSHLSFDGVKDLMKYYFDNLDDSATIVVRDYYSQKAIDAKKSFFVLGSDVYGPMGEELIPFNSLEDAKTFSMDHQGKRIVKFSEITKKDLY